MQACARILVLSSQKMLMYTAYQLVCFTNFTMLGNKNMTDYEFIYASLSTDNYANIFKYGIEDLTLTPPNTTGSYTK